MIVSVVSLENYHPGASCCPLTGVPTAFRVNSDPVPSQGAGLGV